MPDGIVCAKTHKPAVQAEKLLQDRFFSKSFHGGTDAQSWCRIRVSIQGHHEKQEKLKAVKEPLENRGSGQA